MMLRALGNRVLVKVDSAPEETQGGITIPDSAKESIQILKGEVVSVGSKVEQVSVGDRVHFNKYFGLVDEDECGPLLCLREEELLSVEVAVKETVIEGEFMVGKRLKEAVPNADSWVK